MVSNIFIILVCVPAILGYVVPKKDVTDGDTELVLLNVLFRHGARTVDYFYPNDPYQNADFYPIGIGGLTNEGKRGEYQLGEFLRNNYGDFIGDTYTDEELSVRATDYVRTRMSAQLALAALFPPKGVQVWNQDLGWQPIPVDYKRGYEEDLIHPDDNCPYKNRTYEDLPNRAEVQRRFIDKYQEEFAYTEKYTGMPVRNPNDMLNVYFILRVEEDLGFQLPAWTKKLYPEKMIAIGSKLYSYHNSDNGTRTINAGYLLNKILFDAQNKIDGSSKKKLYLYSAHESSIGYMLTALLNDDIDFVPEYSSALLFEVHRRKEEYFVKIRLRKQPKTNGVVDIQLPGCDVLCPLDDFKKITAHLMPTVPLEQLCERP